MDYTNLLLGAIVFVLLGGFSAMYLYFKPNKIETSNVLYTADQVLDVVFVIVSAMTEDNETIAKVYSILDSILDYAQVLVEFETLNKQLLIQEALEDCELAGIVLTDKDKAVLVSAVELIYIFVSK